MLEPYEGKLSRTVLRGGSGSNAADLLDSISDNNSESPDYQYFTECS
ncbi:MAG: hypothetical protein HQ521_14425 [Bacteroidetes bacterium]|nr:hypothetical protein [Bacteroidota bacterium]